MFPVLSREVVEGKQRVAILDQALDSLVVFDAPSFDEGVEELGVHCRRTDRSLPGRSTIALRSGALIALASCPRNPFLPSAGQSSHRAWPPRARAPPRHRPRR